MDELSQLNLAKENAGASTGGSWWCSLDQPKLESVNPSNGNVIATVSQAVEQDYQHIVSQSQKAFQSWRQVPAPKRGEVVRAIADALRAKKDYLGTLVSLETGKIKQEGDGEVQEMIDIADFAVGLSRMLYGKTMHSERPQHRMYEQWHPLGPVGVISAFNFPVAVWAWNAMIAVVCGNTVIWKPSPKSPLCALAVQHICNDVLKDFGYDAIFSVFVSSDVELAKAMVDDPQLPLISFTGSTAVGRLVAERVGRRLGRSILELGGNNAIIVAEDADFKKAVPSIVFGAVGTTGQRCTSTRRIIVARSRYEELLEQLIEAYKQVQIGDALHPNTLMGPLVDADAIQSYVQTIDEIKAQGGEILYGGKVIDQPGFFVEPTLVLAKAEWNIVKTETFGPILYVMPFNNIDEAISIHNSVSQGLSSALFTESMMTAERFLSATGSDCGIANVNIGTSGAEIGGAFGGEKDTGGGREAGSDAWKAYMRRQTCTMNWGEELQLAQGIKFEYF